MRQKGKREYGEEDREKKGKRIGRGGKSRLEGGEYVSLVTRPITSTRHKNLNPSKEGKEFRV